MILWIIYILLDALGSWYLIEKKKKEINHLVATLVRWWAMVLIGITVPITEHTLLPWMVFTSTSFWLFFDPLLNLFRGKPFFYIGENAKIDKFGHDRKLAYWGMKVIALLVMIIVIIML